ncbi:MAG TPA: shikimate dehydrogenase [Verrucomicrobiae bacterium]|jgi:shikimate dehydrogenase
MVSVHQEQFELPSALAYKESVSDGAHDSVNASTRYCAVFGHPVRHSASPAMQNAGLAALDLNWRYLAFDVHPDHLRPAIEGARLMGFIGLNLTVPHKLLALDMVDVVDGQARVWGAVNTIVFEARDPAGQWTPVGSMDSSPGQETRSRGYNTDADAIVQSLQEEFGLENLFGAAVLILGAGGAARAAALRLAREGLAALYLVNRTKERAAKLAAEIAQTCPGTLAVQGYPLESVDLVINATSLGLKPRDPLPIDLQWLQTHRPKFVYDMVYRPMETELLRAARKAGCRAASGAGMLLHQGTRALELWTRRPAPVSVMRTALEKNLNG